MGDLCVVMFKSRLQLPLSFEEMAVRAVLRWAGGTGRAEPRVLHTRMDAHLQCLIVEKR